MDPLETHPRRNKKDWFCIQISQKAAMQKRVKSEEPSNQASALGTANKRESRPLIWFHRTHLLYLQLKLGCFSQVPDWWSPIVAAA